VKCGETGQFQKCPSWQGNCLEKGAEILVALKRNDEYALAHQSRARLIGFRAPEIETAL
jgi:hypothetical protein